MLDHKVTPSLLSVLVSKGNIKRWVASNTALVVVKRWVASNAALVVVKRWVASNGALVVVKS